MQLPPAAAEIESSFQLPLELQAAVLACLPDNEQALVGRLVSWDACRRLGSSRAARFRLPLPPSACDPAWQPHLHQALKQLTFADKLNMLSAAAASGSEANLELAWGLLRPCLHPELLPRPQGRWSVTFYVDLFEFQDRLQDPGEAAVQAGHAATVLPWLVRHDCPLHPRKTLAAAVQHCDLAGLQAAWQLLGYGCGPLKAEPWAFSLARAAGLSGGDCAIAKLVWLRSVALESTWPEHQQLQFLVCAAVGAATAGSLPVLTWLRGLGLDLGNECRGWECRDVCQANEAWATVLGAALQGGHVAVADWLVDEAGCPLPSEETREALMHVWLAAAEGGHVEALRWLRGRGLPVYGQSAEQAAKSGQLEALRVLHTECGAVLTEKLFVEAAGSRSVPTTAWLLQAGCPMGPGAYVSAARVGDADMVAWLAQEAGCPLGRLTAASIVREWPQAMPNRPGLHWAMEVLVGAGCPLAGDDARSLVDTAAARGDLWLLRRLHGELEVGLTSWTLAEAAGGGCEEVLEWVVATGWVDEEEGNDDYHDWEAWDGSTGKYGLAGRHGDMATLACLQRLEIAVDPHVVFLSARVSPSPVVRWLLEHGAPWGGAEVGSMADMIRCSLAEMIETHLRDDRYPESRAWLRAQLYEDPDGL